jgi:hypothetical protein
MALTGRGCDGPSYRRCIAAGKPGGRAFRCRTPPAHPIFGTMSSVLPFLIVVAVFGTLAVLGVGVISMLRGGSFNAKYSNRLMRLRILMQFVAICLLGIAFLVFHR